MPLIASYLVFLFFAVCISNCLAFQSTILEISTGVTNARTVIVCGFSIHIYPSFASAQALICPCASIREDRLQLIDMNITIETNKEVHLYLSPPSLFSPVLSIKSHNNSRLPSSHSTEFYTYYFQLSSELTCRYSSILNQSTCFYYPSSMNFTELEQHYDQLNNSSLTAVVRSRARFLIIYVILSTLLLTTCILGLYLLCTKRLSSEHMIQLDYTIDPQLAREAAIKLAPEPV